MYIFLSRFYNCTDSRRANQVSTGSAVSSSIPPLESFRGPAGFREKVFLGAVTERSSVPIKYEAIGDTSNASDVRGASVETDSSSIYGHQVQSLTTRNSRRTLTLKVLQRMARTIPLRWTSTLKIPVQRPQKWLWSKQ